jgi:hypothetical protein
VPCHASFFEVAAPSMEFTHSDPSMVSPPNQFYPTNIDMFISNIHCMHECIVCRYVYVQLCMFVGR